MNKITYRKNGMSVVRQLVVLDASLARRLEDAVAELGITKSKAVNTALNLWLNTVNKPIKGGQ